MTLQEHNIIPICLVQLVNASLQEIYQSLVERVYFLKLLDCRVRRQSYIALVVKLSLPIGEELLKSQVGQLTTHIVVSICDGSWVVFTLVETLLLLHKQALVASLNVSDTLFRFRNFASCRQ